MGQFSVEICSWMGQFLLKLNGETAAFERKMALELVEQSEFQSSEVSLLKERRAHERERTEGQRQTEPALSHPDEFNRAAKEPIDLTAEFDRASRSTGDAGEATGGAVQGSQRPKGRWQSSIAGAHVSGQKNRSARPTRGGRPRTDDGGPSPAQTCASRERGTFIGD
jgi:hypothetical protein